MKKIGLVASAIVLAVSALGVISPRAYAAGQTCTWTGGAGDYKFSSASNWSGCASAAPTAGDDLLFTTWVGPVNGSTSNAVYLTNDLSNIAFGSVTANGTSTNSNLYEVDTLKLVDGGVFTITPNGNNTLNVYIEDLTSTGAVTLDGGFVGGDLTAASAVFKGAAGVGGSTTTSSVVLQSGAEGRSSITNGKFSLGDASSITIQNGARLVVCSPDSGVTPLTNNFTFGGGSGATPSISVEPCMEADGQPAFPTTGLNLKGSITLLSDATISTLNKRLIVDGTLTSNGHQLALNAGSGSTIMGHGTLGNINLASGSMIAPGNSPGCLTTGNITWVQGAIYSFDLGGTTVCTEYDQIKVNGTVGLGNGTLTIVQYGNFLPKVGDAFTIIDNDGSDAVAGTFDGLAEGATFTQNGIVFKISYVGGDGNDVTLTVQNQPTAPDTGVAILRANPVLIAGVTLTGVVVLLGLARFSTKRR